MSEPNNMAVDARIIDALKQYFNGVSPKGTIGDCTVLSGIRKQNSAPVDIYTPTYNVSQDDDVRQKIGESFQAIEKITDPLIQSTERVMLRGDFKKAPAIALLSCPHEAFTSQLDAQPMDYRLALFDQILAAVAVLHGANIIHGNIHPGAFRREEQNANMKLCDFAWSGGRATTVTAQPAAYQSKHVISSSAPRLVDDVYAAGMIGYRLLLGPLGPEQVLTGRAEEIGSEQLVSAIASEGRKPPDGATLFPEGHPGADQIARVLEKMTSDSPYTSADIALKALRSVIDGGDELPPLLDQKPVRERPVQPERSSGGRSGGISSGLGIALMGGFVAAAGAAVFFFLENQSAQEEIMGMQARLDRANRAFEVVQADVPRILEAERQMSQADFSGASTASAAASTALTTAMTAKSDALTALNDFQFSDWTGKIDDALTAAGEAQSLTAAVVAEVEAAQAAASEARAVAETAGAEITDAMALFNDGGSAFGEKRFEDAVAFLGGATEGFQAATAAIEEQAVAARAEAETSKEGAAEATETAEYADGVAQMEAGDGAFGEGQFGGAKSAFELASAAFLAAREEAERLAREEAERLAREEAERLAREQAERDRLAAEAARVREIRIGASREEMSAAVALCRLESPAGAGNCPTERAASEGQRNAQVAPFELDKTEVSAAEFARFVEETGYTTDAERGARVVAITSNAGTRFVEGEYTWSTPRGKNTTYQTNPDLPAIVTTMNDAMAYCAWAGKRVPSEAEWEFAARGGSERVFPWSNEWVSANAVWRGAPEAAKRLPQAVSAAGAQSPEGIVGLAGNAREWVVGAEGEAVLKGGSWNTTDPGDLRVAARLVAKGSVPGVDFGFRCAKDLEAWQ